MANDRISQIPIEVAIRVESKARMSQVVIEVAVKETIPTAPSTPKLNRSMQAALRR